MTFTKHFRNYSVVVSSIPEANGTGVYCWYGEVIVKGQQVYNTTIIGANSCIEAATLVRIKYEARTTQENNTNNN